jgi:hypothetical protein
MGEAAKETEAAKIKTTAVKSIGRCMRQTNPKAPRL